MAIDVPAIVQAIAMVESTNRVVVGDGGRAISMYQIHEAFWLDCWNWQQRKPWNERLDIGQQWHDIGDATAVSIQRSTHTCTVGVEMIADYLQNHDQPVMPENIYAAFTEGRQAFHDCNFDINDPKFPAFKRPKCAQVGDFVRIHATPASP